MMKKKGSSLERRRRRAGFLFVLPWIIGLFAFFIRPLLSSFIYSVSNVSFSSAGVTTEYMGFKNYHDAFFTDIYFSKRLVSELLKMLWQTPVIVAFSLFMSVILNGKFKGRSAARTVFFLPVIVGSGIALSIMNGDSMPNALTFGTRSSMLFETAGIDAFLAEIGIGQQLIDLLMTVINNLFSLVWRSGLQILLFMSGQLSISGSLYESARVEGATGWDMFWKITFPLISPIIILNVVYTLIDMFSDYSNQVMQYIYTFAKSLNLSFSSALSTIYFLIIIAIVGAVYLVINRRVVYAVK